VHGIPCYGNGDNKRYGNPFHKIFHQHFNNFGHRGANQPVHDTDADRVFITSQNHGFALGEMPDGISQVFTNLNDRTCEGIRGPGCWSVQFHPEASPGPLDANVLFEQVREMANG